jgi:hypothetical protein
MEKNDAWLDWNVGNLLLKLLFIIRLLRLIIEEILLVFRMKIRSFFSTCTLSKSYSASTTLFAFPISWMTWFLQVNEKSQRLSTSSNANLGVKGEMNMQKSQLVWSRLVWLFVNETFSSQLSISPLYYNQRKREILWINSFKLYRILLNLEFLNTFKLIHSNWSLQIKCWTFACKFRISPNYEREFYTNKKQLLLLTFVLSKLFHGDDNF